MAVLSKFLLALHVLVFAVMPSHADDKKFLSMELNTLSPQETSCRLTFVAHNMLGEDLEALVYETVLFDTNNQVLTMTLFDFGSLPNDRPRVRQFDLPNTNCEDLGRILLNDAHACAGENIEKSSCSTSLRWSSRVNVEVTG